MTRRSPLPCIGVFDSGVGGLTVLKALHELMPEAPLLYVADTAHAPYGDKSSAAIVARSLAIAEHLWREGAQLLVVACNTATAHAVQALRARWPGRTIVGIEPGIKPAAAASRNGRIGVLATPATVASARYQALLQAHGSGVQVISQPCPGLVDLIETGTLDSPALQDRVEHCCAPLRAAGVDTVLMGCTHYPLIQPLLQRSLGPQVSLLNIEQAVARQVQRLWPAAAAQPRADIRLQSTGDTAVLGRMARLALGPDAAFSLTRIEL